jgi:hypothetical protein
MRKQARGTREFSYGRLNITDSSDTESYLHACNALQCICAELSRHQCERCFADWDTADSSPTPCPYAEREVKQKRLQVSPFKL